MIHRLVTPTLCLAVVGATLLAPTDAKAGVIPWVYDSIFGSSQSAYSAYGHSANYRPSYTYYSAYGGGYSAPLSGWHRPSGYSQAGYSAPNCSTCNNACPGGNCGISATAQKPTPVEDGISAESTGEGPNKTFADEKSDAGKGDPPPPGENSGFRAAKKPLTFAGTEPTNGDAEVDKRLSVIEDQNMLIMKRLEELQNKLDGLDRLNAKLDAIEALETKVETLEKAAKDGWNTPGTAPKTDAGTPPEGAKTDIDDKSKSALPALPE